jgi:hypothetical protein
MTAHDPVSDPPPPEELSPEDAEAFELLDRYLNSLHEGDLLSRSALMERHPALFKWMRSLELLDRLAPEGLGRRPRPDDQPLRAADAAPQPFGRYELLE